MNKNGYHTYYRACAAFLLFVPIPGSGGLNAKDLAEIWSGATGYFIMVGAALLFTSILLMVGIAASRLSAKMRRTAELQNQPRAGIALDLLTPWL